VVQEEIAESVDTLDRLSIRLKGGEKGGVVSRYEAVSVFIGPELVLVRKCLHPVE